MYAFGVRNRYRLATAAVRRCTNVHACTHVGAKSTATCRHSLPYTRYINMPVIGAAGW